MRSIFIGLLICLATQTVVGRQRAAIPLPAKNAFATAYPGVQKVKWEKEHGKYEATFHYKNRIMSALYTSEGAVVEIETIITPDELPKNARQYATAKGTITETAKIVTADGAILYEATVHHKNLIFDEDGNFMTEKSDRD